MPHAASTATRRDPDADRGPAGAPHPARRGPDRRDGRGGQLRRPGPAGDRDRGPPPGQRAGRVGDRDRRAGPLRPPGPGPGRPTTSCWPGTAHEPRQRHRRPGRELKLPTVRAQAARLAEIAARDHATHLGYLAEILAAALDDRSARRRARRIADARFPRLKRLADFSTDAVPAITPALLAHLATGAYLDNGEPVVLLGDSGTGKTHLLIGLGLAACEQGHRVRYVTTAALVNELVEAADDRALSRVVGRYGRLDLLCLDELGSRSTPGAPSCSSRSSPSGRKEPLSLSRPTPRSNEWWGTVFPDPRLVAAIVDRVTFNAHILETGTQSYRLSTTKTATRAKNPG